jgi:pimeloyl-ACP methyl ester carboxylesterase
MRTSTSWLGGVVAAASAADDGSVPVAERKIMLHGRRVSYLESGADSGGPVVVLLHGLGGSSSTWSPVMALLGPHAHVIAPDLLGHGRSAKPRDGDYSLGAHAAGLRDLLVAIGLDRATVIGHSFGGGVAMQFAYQFPELIERLVLVASGGLGREVTPVLRAATLPGTALALGTVTRLTPRWVGRLVHRTVRAVPGISRPEVDEVAQSLAALAHPAARDAFVHTVRGALDLGGQRLNGLQRLNLVGDAPLLLVGGGKDLCIPTAHTTHAHNASPGSRLELFPSSGHFPHRDQPGRFARVVRDFLVTTPPYHADLEDTRRRLRETTVQLAATAA